MGFHFSLSKKVAFWRPFSRHITPHAVKWYAPFMRDSEI